MLCLDRRTFCISTTVALLACATSLPSRAIYILIDTSGTYYAQHARVFQALRSIILRLRTGDVIRIAQINECSFTEDAVLATFVMPEKERAVNNAKRAMIGELERVRKSLLRAGFTDITGSILAAADFLSTVTAQKRIILMFSDLREDLSTVCTREAADLTLKGISVAAAFVIKLPGDNARGYTHKPV